MTESSRSDVTVTIPADLAAKLSSAYEAWSATLDAILDNDPDTGPAVMAALWRANADAELALADVYSELAYSVGPFVPLISAVHGGVDSCRRNAGRHVAFADRLEGRAS